MTIFVRTYVRCDRCGRESEYPNDGYLVALIPDAARAAGKRIADFCDNCRERINDNYTRQ